MDLANNISHKCENDKKIKIFVKRCTIELKVYEIGLDLLFSFFFSSSQLSDSLIVVSPLYCPLILYLRLSLSLESPSLILASIHFFKNKCLVYLSHFCIYCIIKCVKMRFYFLKMVHVEFEKTALEISLLIGQWEK